MIEFVQFEVNMLPDLVVSPISSLSNCFLGIPISLPNCYTILLSLMIFLAFFLLIVFPFLDCWSSSVSRVSYSFIIRVSICLAGLTGTAASLS